MRGWVIRIAALLTGLLPTMVHAQGTTSNTACQQLIFASTLPLLQYATRFSPSGFFPYGYAPLAQPFATNPFEGALYGYPSAAYYTSYALPGFAARRPMLYPAGYPQASVYPELYPPDGVPVPAVQPDPELSSSAILEQLRRDGTWDQLSSTERANFLMQLASLQQTEIGQRIAQASLQQNAQANIINSRRVPFELSATYQSNARDWFQSYLLYAQVLQNLLQATCNPSTGTVGLTPFGGSLTSLAFFCAFNTLNLPICAGLR
ncbi:MAG TPA: hypothetical protein VKZ60_01105 [Chloroflexota bacterium]|nr:hypothetical protein [Chloroflexota bacterium]